MERTTSACPRDRSAHARPSILGLGQKLKLSDISEKLGGERALQAAAGLHLLAIAAAVLAPGNPPLPIFLTLTGLCLVVLSLSRSDAAPVATDDVAEFAPAVSVPDDRAFALERQSQRLVEIADAASRARREAEMRGQLWAELTARMSHELRTPLNAVIGFSDVMGAEMFGPLGHDRYRDYARHIRECGRDLLKCAEDTLALTSTLAGGQNASAGRPLELRALLTDAWSFFEAESSARGIQLDTRIPRDMEILGEPRPVRQILVNLLAEALDRCPDGGIVRVVSDTDDQTVSLAIAVAGAAVRANVGQAPLAICIARVLLEQHGSGLIEDIDASGAWRATTFLDRAVQKDFFV